MWNSKIVCWGITVLPGGLAGALWGLRSQLYYLSFTDWEYPEIRIPAGIVLGVLSGWILAFVLAYAKRLTTKKPVEKKDVRSAGYVLLGIAAIVWFLWPVIDTWPWWCVLLLCLMALMIRKDRACFSMGWLLAGVLLLAGLFWGKVGVGEPLWLVSVITMVVVFLCGLWGKFRTEMWPKENRRVFWPYVLVAIVLLGFGLRFCGMDHGVPNFVAHCDTPKQLERIPPILKGNLKPPNSYPFGHIYFFSGLIAQFRGMETLGSPLHQWVWGGNSNYIITARTIQVLMGALIPLIVFFITRHLWETKAALLAAFLVAVDSIHLTYSRQVMGEIPQAFWVLLSFYFTVRASRDGKVLQYCLAGVAAGAAFAIKMYGGFIVTAAFLVWFVNKPREIKIPVVVTLGFLIGVVVFSPYLLVDPQGWFKNIQNEIAYQYSIGGNRSPLIGLKYLATALNHRFGVVWILLSLLGITWLLAKRRRRDLVFLVVLGESLAIIALRLRYLREWDFVFATPFLSMAIAVFLVYLLASFKRVNNLYSVCVKGFVCVWLASCLFASLGDAYVARLTDTIDLARNWISRHLSPHERISGGNDKSLPFYCMRNASPLRVIDSQGKRKLQFDPAAKILVSMQLWWEKDPPITYSPVTVLGFRSLNYFWENPKISIYVPDAPKIAPQIILPHNRVIIPQSATYLRTAWAYSRPTDLIWGFLSEATSRYGTKAIFSDTPIDNMAYLALGKASLRLYLGPEASIPLKVFSGKLEANTFKPWRSLFPLFPYNYKVLTVQEKGRSVCWVGMYPQPETAAPMLARFGHWKALEKLTAAGLSRENLKAPLEASLFYAAALSEKGQREKAQGVLKSIKKYYPKFVSNYRRLTHATSGEFMQRISNLSTANKSLLLGEQISWSIDGIPDGPPGEPGWGRPSFNSTSDHFNIWFPYAFLPGFFRARVVYHLEQHHNDCQCALEIIAHYPKTFFRPGLLFSSVKKVRIERSKNNIEIPFELTHGPVRLEVKLISDKASYPKIDKVTIYPDLQSEFSWRWKLLTSRLPDLSD